jgi:hypothetical protein
LIAEKPLSLRLASVQAGATDMPLPAERAVFLRLCVGGIPTPFVSEATDPDMEAAFVSVADLDDPVDEGGVTHPCSAPRASE